MTDFFSKIFKGKFHSLRVAMLYALLVGLVFASVTFVGVKYLSKTIIENVYMSEEKREIREEDYANDLQNYVIENQLTSEDIESLAKWARKNKYIYIMITKDDQLLFESGIYDDELKDEETNPDGTDTEVSPDGTKPDGTKPEVDPDHTKPEVSPDGTNVPNAKPNEKDKDKHKYPSPGFTVDGPTKEELKKFASENNQHAIFLKDATVLASMADFSEYWYFDMANVTAMSMAVLVLIIVIMLYFHGVTIRISKLGKDVTAVAEGDINRPIHAKGTDEIAKLSEDVEYMRSSILDTVQKEREAIDANSQLITSMSHDIRTPLTILLGYLDMMKLHSNDKVMSDYISASEKTALRLKKLSDDLFNYFLVFGEGVKNTELTEYDAGMLIEQLLFEHVLLLREKGCIVDLNYEDGIEERFASIKVITDAPQLMRIVENIFSNIHKYADMNYPVSINIGLTPEKKVIFQFINRISKESNNVESNRIGVKTCYKIAEAINAGFNIEDDGKKYEVIILLNTDTSNEKEKALLEPPQTKQKRNKKDSQKSKQNRKNNDSQESKQNRKK